MSTVITAPVTINQTTISAAVQVQQPAIAAPVAVGTDPRFSTSEAAKFIDGDKARLDAAYATTIPLGEPMTTNVTLSSAYTDYLLPPVEKEGRRTIVVSNNSAEDVYLGQQGVIDAAADPPVGIMLPAGGSLTLDCTAGLYAQAATAGVKLTVTEF